MARIVMRNVLYVIMVASIMMISVLCTGDDIQQQEDAMICSVVADNFQPCLNYLKASGGEIPPTLCCNGLKKTSLLSKRKVVCKCLNDFIGSLKNINQDNAAGLPRKCGVNMPYRLPNTDCTK
uniref:non-specific lipid-transfer protein 1-like n=1 Tax=Erigeron canadensis TaxID=72917 RepID=UPI001CB94E3D|nr:non-specific lipid-transfer protein 1-like [Erigeron canadensis]